MKHRKLRMGMVGGGSDAFIGAIHRRAAFMDNQIELVCGCFSVDPEISKSSGLSYYLPEDRIYSTYQEMFEHEMTLPEGERMDFWMAYFLMNMRQLNSLCWNGLQRWD